MAELGGFWSPRTRLVKQEGANAVDQPLAAIYRLLPPTDHATPHQLG